MREGSCECSDWHVPGQWRVLCTDACQLGLSLGRGSSLRVVSNDGLAGLTCEYNNPREKIIFLRIHLSLRKMSGDRKSVIGSHETNQ